MNLKRHLYKVVVVIALFRVGTCTGQKPTPSPAFQMEGSNLCAKLNQVTHIPFQGEPVNDPIYNKIAANRQAVIPCLIEQITNETKMPDPRSEPVASNFKVGDLAFFLLIDFTGVQFEEMLPPDVRVRLNSEGVYAYFQYVSTPGNRVKLKGKWQKWLKSNKQVKVSKENAMSREPGHTDPPKAH